MVVNKLDCGLETTFEVMVPELTAIVSPFSVNGIEVTQEGRRSEVQKERLPFTCCQAVRKAIGSKVSPWTAHHVEAAGNMGMTGCVCGSRPPKDSTEEPIKAEEARLIHGFRVSGWAWFCNSVADQFTVLGSVRS